MVEKARAAVRRFFARRQLADIRTVADISQSGREQFLSAKLWPRGPLFTAFTGRAAATLPGSLPSSVEGNCSKTDFYFFDFDPKRRPFDTLDLKKCWLQWHGTSFYGLSSIMAFNYIAASRKENRGHEFCCGEGIYTAHEFNNAVHFSTRHIFTNTLLDEDYDTDFNKENTIPINVKCTLLVLIPGDASPNGVGVWHRLSSNKKPLTWVWNDGTNEQIDSWQVSALPSAFQWDFSENIRPAAPFDLVRDIGVDPSQQNGGFIANATMNSRKTRPAHETVAPWTNVAPDVDQCISNEAVVLGVAISYGSSYAHNQQCSKTTARSKNVCFGWNAALELPYGRPLDDWNTRPPFPSGHRYHEIGEGAAAEGAAAGSASSSWTAG